MDRPARDARSAVGGRARRHAREGARPAREGEGTRVGERARQLRERGARARLLVSARARGGRLHGGIAADAVGEVSERHVALQLVRRPVAASEGFLQARLRRLRLVRHRRAELRGAEGLRHTDLLEHPLSPPRQSALHGPRLQSRFVLPHHVHRAGRLEGPHRVPALRGRVQRLLRVGERREGGLQRGQLHRPRVQRHEVPPSRRQPARRGGLPLERRRVPRGPGLLPLLRHLPQRDALRDAEDGNPRLPRHRGPRQQLPRRHHRPRRGPPHALDRRVEL